MTNAKKVVLKNCNEHLVVMDMMWNLKQLNCLGQKLEQKQLMQVYHSITKLDSNIKLPKIDILNRFICT
jgi:hypothetical protein